MRFLIFAVVLHPVLSGGETLLPRSLSWTVVGEVTMVRFEVTPVLKQEIAQVESRALKSLDVVASRRSADTATLMLVRNGETRLQLELRDYLPRVAIVHSGVLETLLILGQ